MKIKMENELYHFGIKGMKWGIRRYQNKDGSLTSAGKKRYSDSSSVNDGIKDLTDQELLQRVNRLNLEKRYRELSSPSEQKKVNAGKEFVTNILKTSGQRVANELAFYAMGTAANKLFRANIVNVKNLDKDKNK